MELTEQALDFCPLRSGRGQPREQRTGLRCGVGFAARFRVRDGEIESRLVEIRLGGERRLERLDRVRQVAFRCLQNADVGDDDRVAGLEALSLGEGTFGPREIVAAAAAGRNRR